MKIDDKIRKEIEDLINNEYDNVSNLDVKDDGEIFFTLPVRHGRFGYDRDDLMHIESKNKAIQIEVVGSQVEEDDPDDSYKKILAVTCKATIDDELMGESYRPKHIKMFEQYMYEKSIKESESKNLDSTDDWEHNLKIWLDDKFKQKSKPIHSENRLYIEKLRNDFLSVIPWEIRMNVRINKDDIDKFIRSWFDDKYGK